MEPTDQSGFSSVHEGLKVSLSPAPIGKRILAYCVDLGLVSVCLYGLLIFFFILFAGLMGGLTALGAGDGSKVVVLVAFIGAVLLVMFSFDLYFILYETRKAQTPGKKLFGLSVVSQNGGRPSFGQCVIRDLFRWVECFPILPGLIAMLASSKHRRIGDLAAGTMVVHSEHRENANQYLYLTQEAYEYLRVLYDPKPIPPELAKSYLKLAFPSFITNRAPRNYYNMASFDEAFTPYIKKMPEDEANWELRMRFIAEHCLKGLNSMNKSNYRN
jgi:uncharacterized RDD family membrane protein YckC